MAKENYSLTYYDEFDKQCRAHFTINEYHNLMELLFDKYVEDWGDCKGRAWCGTCHIEIIEGSITEKMNSDEKLTLSKIGDYGPQSRLACQIPVTPQLDDIVFKIITD